MARELKPYEVLTGKCRLSYMYLYDKRKADTGGKDKYQCTLLIPKSDKKTIEAIKTAQQAVYEDNKNSKLKGIKFAGVKTTLRDGDDEKDTDAFPEYKNHMFISVSSSQKVTLLDTDGRELDRQEEEDREILYSGCYARAKLAFYAYDTSGSKGITAYVNGVKKVADGEPLVGSVVTNDDFEDDDFEDLGL
jgi:hypothetical protein